MKTESGPQRPSILVIDGLPAKHWAITGLLEPCGKVFSYRTYTGAKPAGFCGRLIYHI